MSKYPEKDVMDNMYDVMKDQGPYGFKMQVEMLWRDGDAETLWIMAGAAVRLAAECQHVAQKAVWTRWVTILQGEAHCIWGRKYNKGAWDWQTVQRERETEALLRRIQMEQLLEEGKTP